MGILASNSQHNPRHVRFDKTTRVVLVPCRKEYFDHGLGETLWWQSDDYVQFKSSLYSEYLKSQNEIPLQGSPVMNNSNCSNDNSISTSDDINSKENSSNTNNLSSSNAIDEHMRFIGTRPKIVKNNNSYDTINDPLIIRQKKIDKNVVHPLALMLS